MKIQEKLVTHDDMPEDKWKQVGGQAQVYWDKLTDEDLETIGGKAERLADVLQRKYGYIKQHAESQSIRWMRKHRDGPADTQ
jgi:uncharacterized protein YjbJ (UPF0337 family)